MRQPPLLSTQVPQEPEYTAFLTVALLIRICPTQNHFVECTQGANEMSHGGRQYKTMAYPGYQSNHRVNQ